jgi:hypothetical protein
MWSNLNFLNWVFSWIIQFIGTFPQLFVTIVVMCLTKIMKIENIYHCRLFTKKKINKKTNNTYTSFVFEIDTRGITFKKYVKKYNPV